MVSGEIVVTLYKILVGVSNAELAKEMRSTDRTKPRIVRFTAERLYRSGIQKKLAILCHPIFDPVTGCYASNDGDLLTEEEKPSGARCWFAYYPEGQQGVIGVYDGLGRTSADDFSSDKRVNYSDLY